MIFFEHGYLRDCYTYTLHILICHSLRMYGENGVSAFLITILGFFLNYMQKVDLQKVQKDFLS